MTQRSLGLYIRGWFLSLSGAPFRSSSHKFRQPGLQLTFPRQDSSFWKIAGESCKHGGMKVVRIEDKRVRTKAENLREESVIIDGTSANQRKNCATAASLNKETDNMHPTC